MKTKKLIIFVFTVLISCLTYGAPLTPVVIGNKIWYQPYNFLNLTWNEIASACPQNGDPCERNITNWGYGNKYDYPTPVKGLVWASVNDIDSLFRGFIGNDFPSGGPRSYEEYGSAWSKVFFVKFQETYGFIYDYSGYSVGSIYGITSTTDPKDHSFAFTGDLTGYSILPDLHGIYPYPDSASTDHSVPKNFSFENWGAWFYKPVPEPSALRLLMVGMMIIGLYEFLNRRRRNF